MAEAQASTRAVMDRWAPGARASRPAAGLEPSPVSPPPATAPPSRPRCTQEPARHRAHGAPPGEQRAVATPAWSGCWPTAPKS